MLAFRHDVDRAADALLTEGLVGLRGALTAADCARWVAGTYAGRAAWTADFGDDQFSLGRAFYTHLEQQKSAAYFADAAASDARVEALAPGLQSAMRALAARLVRGSVRPRRGWCGPGVHVFPCGAHVARKGGVLHFDTEGLTEHQLARGARAFSLVCMLQPPVRGGGLRIWDLRYEGEDAVSDEALAAAEGRAVTAAYAVGDAVAFDSYRLHQIQPFSGKKDRVSATIHLAEIDDGHWESWF